MIGRHILKTCAVYGAAVVSAYAQGSLTPPGAPAPTMKALDEIEPRTPITSLPFTISAPGSYYVTGPLSSISSGITIETNNVTLDLNGFTLSGPAGAASNPGIGLVGTPASPRLGVTVRNGAISGFHHGVQSTDSAQCVFEDLTIHAPVQEGFRLNCSAGGVQEANTIRRCVVARAGDVGIFISSSATAICRQNVISDCVVVESGGSGIEFTDAAGELFQNRIERCSVSFSGGAGIALLSVLGGTTSGNLIEACSVYDSSASGILLSADGGTCRGNAVRDCTVSHAGTSGSIEASSTSLGACDGNVIESCTVSEPDLFGILVLGLGSGAGNVIRDNLVSSGTSYGIRVQAGTATRIENNHVHSATGAVSSVGIFTAAAGSSDNLVIRNSSIGHNSNFALSASDTYGPFITGSGALSPIGQESHPAANFSQ